MSSPAQDVIRRHRYTVEDYHRMAAAGILRQGQRVELIKGEIIDMTPIGSRHAATVAHLAKLLTNAVGEHAIVWTQNPIVLDDHSEPEPDLALLRSHADYYASAHPRPADVLLIIEVADSSLHLDRDVKIPLYSSQGIPEVWLFDLEAKQLTVYRNPSVDGYGRIVEPKSLDRLTIPGLKDVAVDVSRVLWI